jgi:DNA-binding Lrp family transcriptional regulator
MARDLDRTDFAILSALQNDARLSNKELAAKVRLAPSSCLERVRRLREQGVLLGSHARVDPRALGVELQAMIAVRLGQHAPELVATFRDAMLRRPETVAVYYLAGATDFLVHVAVRDTDHLREVAAVVVDAVEGVRHVETSLIFEHQARPGLPCYRGG